MRSLIAAWKQDTAYNTFVYTQFLISLPFTVFNTYAVYQLQVVGFLIGTDAEGAPCTTYCIVPFGNDRLDLNSVLLYVNAMTFGLGGFIMIFLTAYADFWKNKSLLVTLFLIAYSAVTTPAYWLKDVSLSNFNSFIALYVVFGVFTFILMALLNIYIPHCMRVAKEKEAAISPQIDSPPTDGGTSREYGFSMSVFGTLANGLSATLMLVIVIIIARTIPGPDGQTSGLLVTTIIGFVAVAGSIAAYYGLPELPAKSYPEAGGWKGALLELLTPYREMLLRRRNMMFLLVAYTIYTDSLFALFSVTGQLYYAELKPDTLEYSLYSLSGNLYSVVFTLIFYVLQRRFQWDLGKCLIFGYALILVVPIWGCIGLAPYINFGFKNRWEFYVQQLICYLSQAVANPTFRLLYSEQIPKGEEIMWFGLQVILSCVTTWVNYVATGPLQNSTHELRFPLVICLVFLVVPLVLECLRATLGLFKRDRERWMAELEGESSVAEITVTVNEK